MNPKNKKTLVGEGFLTSPMQSVQLILNFTIKPDKGDLGRIKLNKSAIAC